MQAGVEETDGVDGGVPPKPRDPFGELLLNADTGDGILYLFKTIRLGKKIVNFSLFKFF